MIAQSNKATIVRDAITMREDGEFVTTSLTIAQLVKARHATVLHMARKHIEDLSEFGEVEFHSRPEVAVLNEHQAELLVTQMRPHTQKRKQLAQRFRDARSLIEARAMSFYPELARDLWSPAGQDAARSAMVAV